MEQEIKTQQDTIDIILKNIYYSPKINLLSL